MGRASWTKPACSSTTTRAELLLSAMLLRFTMMLVKQYDEYNNEHNKQNEHFDKRDQLNGHNEVSEWFKGS